MRVYLYRVAARVALHTACMKEWRVASCSLPLLRALAHEWTAAPAPLVSFRSWYGGGAKGFE